LTNEALKFGDLSLIRVRMAIPSNGTLSVARVLRAPLGDEGGVQMMYPGGWRHGGAGFDLS
jgi:hypothetical protein